MEFHNWKIVLDSSCHGGRLFYCVLVYIRERFTFVANEVIAITVCYGLLLRNNRPQNVVIKPSEPSIQLSCVTNAPP